MGAAACRCAALESHRKIRVRDDEDKEKICMYSVHVGFDFLPLPFDASAIWICNSVILLKYNNKARENHSWETKK